MYVVIKSSSDDVRLIGLYIMSVIGLLFTHRSVASRRLDSSVASLWETQHKYSVVFVFMVWLLYNNENCIYAEFFFYLCMRHPHWCIGYQSQVYINIHSHTQHVLRSYITWQLVLTLNVGHHWAIIQELQNVYRTCMYQEVGDLPLLH
jgi:hypothetical protein